MSTLTRKRIKDCLARREDPLVVTPILDQDQVGLSTVDVRLGNQFIVFRSHTLGAFPANNEADARRVQERQVIRYGSSFVLHPHVLVLAATLEYIRMPNDLEGQVEGRSSWARVGLIVATATSIEPRFRGTVTLELTNLGAVPLRLLPGARVAQLIFRDASPGVEEDGGKPRKYSCAIGPQFSRLAADRDMEVFSRLGAADKRLK
jgi:dCTP deaminase